MSGLTPEWKPAKTINTINHLSAAHLTAVARNNIHAIAIIENISDAWVRRNEGETVFIAL